MDNLTVVLTFIGVTVAIFALVYQRRQEDFAKETARRQEVGVSEWMRDLRDWASEATDVLSEVVYASDDMQDAAPSDVRRQLSKLSALADRGRFFLPNRDTGSRHGQHNPSAFRGLRHAALDPLVAAVNVLDGLVKEKELRDYVIHNRRAVLRELQREFVLHIQQILDPERRNQEIAQLIQHSEKQAEQRIEAILGKDVGPGATALVRIVVESLSKPRQ